MCLAALKDHFETINHKLDIWMQNWRIFMRTKKNEIKYLPNFDLMDGIIWPANLSLIHFSYVHNTCMMKHPSSASLILCDKAT